MGQRLFDRIKNRLHRVKAVSYTHLSCNNFELIIIDDGSTDGSLSLIHI